MFKPYRGPEAVGVLLAGISRVFEDFRHVRQKGAPHARDHALVFQARIGDKEIEGSDFLHLDENGSIDELTVMVRPLSGALTLADAMKRQLASAQVGQGT